MGRDAGRAYGSDDGALELQILVLLLVQSEVDAFFPEDEDCDGVLIRGGGGAAATAYGAFRSSELAGAACDRGGDVR